MINGNDLAFPFQETKEDTYSVSTGLTKRELFAAIAMMGLLSNANGAMNEGSSRVFSPDEVSRLSALHADALIEQLKK